MKLWDLSGYSEKSNIQQAYLPKTSISGQIFSELLAQLCSNDSIQILLKKQFSIFLSHIRLQKQYSSLMFPLKFGVEDNLMCSVNIWFQQDSNSYYFVQRKDWSCDLLIQPKWPIDGW